MERGDLLGINGKIFAGQGRAIQANAASDVRVLVVVNPCNMNRLIANNNAPDGTQRWLVCDDRLDENQTAKHNWQSNRQVSEISNVTIWGNHSATQYPDYYNAKIGGVPAPELIADDTWAHVDFIPTVQQGAIIIQTRGASSAASAANAAIDSVKSLAL